MTLDHSIVKRSRMRNCGSKNISIRKVCQEKDMLNQWKYTQLFNKHNAVK